jgi:mannosyl-3-phosphoglycerate phosphatase
MISLIFTDLDGTLLDRDTYSWEAAKPALEHLKRRGFPWILVTSKTRAEVERLRRVLGNHHPFIVENGAAAFVPTGYFPATIPGATRRDGYDIVEWGKPYAELITGLRNASQVSGCRVLAFHEMTAEEVAAACELPVEEAVWAKQREYDEPFRIIDTARSDQLKAACVAQGLRWVQGGRFYHVCGDNDKASAVKLLLDLFRQEHGPIWTIGLGDSFNDVSFLEVVDLPVIVRSPDVDALRSRIPHARLTERSGPQGWNNAVLRILHQQARQSKHPER